MVLADLEHFRNLGVAARSQIIEIKTLLGEIREANDTHSLQPNLLKKLNKDFLSLQDTYAQFSDAGLRMQISVLHTMNIQNEIHGPNQEAVLKTHLGLLQNTDDIEEFNRELEIELRGLKKEVDMYVTASALLGIVDSVRSTQL